MLWKHTIVGACSTHGGDADAYKIVVLKPEGKRQLRSR
jgi:hypothetical protein